jgi:hypothetical protein
MKVSFVLSLMLGVIFTVATGILWWVLDSLGSFQKLSDVIASILGTGNFDLVQTMTLGHVLMFAGALSAFMCLMTVIVGTLVSYLYNLVTAFTGGVEYTLTQDY